LSDIDPRVIRRTPGGAAILDPTVKERPMARTTQELRTLWREYECAESRMVIVPFGPDRIRVAPPTAPAWAALATVLDHHDYAIRTPDTDSFNCRPAKSGGGRSLHAFGIALDVNWTTNPYRDHAGERAVRWSDKPLQPARSEDVRTGRADTDFTEALIADVGRIATRDGKRVFEWGGSWRTIKDCMHFEIDLSPAELAAGIDPRTVAGGGAAPVPDVAPAPPNRRSTVAARGGLNLRAGPGTHYSVISVCPAGQDLYVLAMRGGWAQVDLQGDGFADGFVSADFLQPLPTSEQPSIAARLTAASVAPLFPAARPATLAANLPHVVAALDRRGLCDRAMVLMALATVRAETEIFAPLSEGQSALNTAARPFDLYDAGTPKAVGLGNVLAGDGPRYRGRGYVQLTGRANYARIGGRIGVDLIAEPERAIEPATAAAILASFLEEREDKTRAALARDDLAAARRLVNGGTHGLDRFTDTYRRGQRAFPA
jgi:predicted chitinase